MNKEMGVTVVVPTLNRGSFLYNCLLDLLAQTHRPLEVLVIDQSAVIPDDVQALAISHQDIISYHSVTFRGLPLARNYGWQHARYEAIVYVDDDVRCPPELVSEHYRALLLPNVGAVAGGIHERNRIEKFSNRAGQFNYWTATPKRGFNAVGEYDVEHAPGGNFAIWRKVAQEVGGFDERLNVGAALYEETEFCLRLREAGYRIYYNSHIQLQHLGGGTGGCRVDEVHRYVWALAHNRTVLIRRHLKWYQQPVAFAELFRLTMAYATHYHQLQVLYAALAGYRAASKL